MSAKKGDDDEARDRDEREAFEAKRDAVPEEHRERSPGPPRLPYRVRKGEPLTEPKKKKKT